MTKNYIPSSMDFVSGFISSKAMGIPDSQFMSVDEEKAVSIIKEQLSQGASIQKAELGLDGDWGENHTEIYDGKNFHKYDSYGGSKWATPLLIIYYNDAPSESYECFKR